MIRLWAEMNGFGVHHLIVGILCLPVLLRFEAFNVGPFTEHQRFVLLRHGALLDLGFDIGHMILLI